MMRKIFIALVCGGMMLALTGCSTINSAFISATESAQEQVDDMASFASDDLTAATELAGSDQLNYPAAAQCLPVLTKWLASLKTKADLYKKVKGVASAVVYQHWAKQQVTGGVPGSVTLACAAMWSTEKGDFADAIVTVKGLLGK